MKKDHALIEMSFRMRVAKTQPCKKPNYAALQTTTGAEAASTAYAAAKQKGEGIIVQQENRQLRPDRPHGPLSFEELGLGVQGLAAGMSAPAAGDYLQPDEPDGVGGGAPAQFGLAAEVKLLELRGKAALEALPKPESEFENRRATVSER